MTFKKTVKQIRDAEKNVDLVLKAARLQRYPMSDRRLEMILEHITVIVAIIAGLIVLIVPMILATYR